MTYCTNNLTKQLTQTLVGIIVNQCKTATSLTNSWIFLIYFCQERQSLFSKILSILELSILILENIIKCWKILAAKKL